MSAATWEPGEPLHHRGLYARPMLELLVDHYEDFSTPGPDAASWPTPRPYDALPGDDLW